MLDFAKAEVSTDTQDLTAGLDEPPEASAAASSPRHRGRSS
jgi:hypothetical protein